MFSHQPQEDELLSLEELEAKIDKLTKVCDVEIIKISMAVLF